ncbi:MAG TPA: hypothetical protein VFF06_00840 [Polyangia bacterium]|nr:hypothetical protein [Polyangia bacterium]
MARPERAESAKYKEAKLQYLWAPVITGLVGLITAVVLHFITDSRLVDASNNFSKLSDSVQAMTAEVQVNREELDRLDRMVEDLIDHLLVARGESSTAATPAAVAQLEKLKGLKQEIATARLRTQAVATPALPHSLFDKGTVKPRAAPTN